MANHIPRKFDFIEHNLEDLTLVFVLCFNGIYFFTKRSKVIYIGQSTRAVERMAVQAERFGKKWDQIFFYSVPPNQDMTLLETAFIRYFNPPENKTHRNDPISLNSVKRLMKEYQYEEWSNE